ncbi:MAG: hypothetical protein ACI9OJ_003977 [Myxococcota bacterium]|jgi:hypothetical protein
MLHPMRTQLLPWLLLISTGLLCLASCGEDVTGGTPLAEADPIEVMITSPEPGALLGGQQVFVSGEVRGTALTDITINGVPAIAENGQFGTWVGLADGSNVITVVHPDSGSSASVTVEADTRPPILTIAAPGRGSIVQTSNTIEVSVAASDESGLSRVQVNGQLLDANAISWTVNVALIPGVNTVRVEAEDARGNLASEHVNVLAGPFRDETQPLVDAMLVHLGPAALAAFDSVGGTLADGLDYTSLAAGLNPIVDNDSVSAVVEMVGLDPGTQVRFETANDHIRLGLVLHNLTADAKLTLKGIGTELDIGLTIARIDITVPLDITTVDGEFDVVLGTPIFQFETPTILVGGESGGGAAEIEGPMLESLEKLLTSTALSFGVDLLDSALKKLTTAFTYPIGDSELGVQLTALNADAGSHGLELRLSGLLTLNGESVVPPEKATGPVSTPWSESYHPRGAVATVAISDDLLNTAAYGLWRIGSLDRLIAEKALAQLTSSSLVAGFLSGLTGPVGLELDPEATLEIGFAAPLPPVAGGVPDSDAVGLIAGDISVSFQADGSPAVGGFLTLAFTAEAITEDQTLRLTLDSTRTLFDLSVGDPELERQVEATFEPVVQHLFSELGPVFEELLGAIPIPTLGPFQATDLSVSSDGTNGQYIVLQGNLATIP